MKNLINRGATVNENGAQDYFDILRSKGNVPPILYKDQKYEPPAQTPNTREEAIYFLTRCGFYALAQPEHMLRVFASVFRERCKIRKNGHIIIPWGDHPRDDATRKNTDTLVGRWIKNKPRFFSGLPGIAEWLRHAGSLAGIPDMIFKSCAQRRSYELATEAAYDDLDPAFLEELADKLWEISNFCNRDWTLNTYLKLVLQYADAVKTANFKNTSDADLKKRLLGKMRSSELHRAYIPRFLPDSEDEWDFNEAADIDINGILEALESPKISFDFIIAQIQHVLNPYALFRLCR